MAVCAACGQENPEGFRFCGACGTELVEAVAPREQRKTVTVLFCDVTGSTALGEELDPETLRRTMARYFDEIRRIVERHGGTVEKFIGDAVMAVFGIPVSHEDDALRSVRAAIEIRERIGSLGEELGVALSFRTGVNTGEVVAGEGETLATGDAVNVAARLEQAAPPGEVLIGATTVALVRDAVEVVALEPLELKGKREPVAAFRLVSVDLAADAFARRFDARLVGRGRERQRLSGDFEHAAAERACHLFTLLGPAGVGKSRLVTEFLADVGDRADVLHARCLHYGEDITYWPLVEILVAIGVDPDDVIGASPADTQVAFRRLLESRAAERPQIVLLDDIQWAEEVFLDLVEHVADLSRDAPIFVLCVARPDLLELRPGWGGGKLNATTVLLEPLSTGDCEQLLGELAGDLELDEEVRQRILAAADGNPLFLEEMIAMASEDGGSDVAVPPTIQALLQARLDRLGADERDVIGRGAIEGQVFHRRVVEELAPADGRERVPGNLLTLVRKDVIRPERAKLPDDDAFRFRHLLIRDAAYDALPKETRAVLHERFADWLEAHGGLVELDEIVGYHLEQAHRNRAELDATDDRLPALARRAAERLAAAARGALTRGDVRATSGLFTRAVELLPRGEEARLELLREALWPLSEVHGFGSVEAGAAELAESGVPRLATMAELARLWAEFFTGAHTIDGLAERLEVVRPLVEETSDDLVLAWFALLTFALSWSQLRAEEGRAAIARGAEHAERAKQPAMAAWLRAWDGAALALGPAPADEVIAVTERALERETTPLGRSGPLRRLGRMLACRGEFERSRAAYREGTEIPRELGQIREAASSCMGMAFIEQRAGDLEAAEAVLRAGVDELETLGDTAYLSTAVCVLAEVLFSRGQYEETARLSAHAKETSLTSDLATQSYVAILDARLAAQRGDCAEAEDLARRAVEILGDADFYEHVGLSNLALAQVLETCGKPSAAREPALRAAAVYDAKGDIVAAGWARDLLARIDSPGSG